MDVLGKILAIRLDPPMYIEDPPVGELVQQGRAVWMPRVHRLAATTQCPTCPQGVPGEPCAPGEPACCDRLAMAGTLSSEHGAPSADRTRDVVARYTGGSWGGDR